MIIRVGATAATVALSLAAFATVNRASAAELPGVNVSDANAVATCATPGRLMAYLKSKNPKLASKFKNVATEYMRHGEELGVRWDYAFFQMLLETGYLTYKGDVKPKQNNFAGLGATGGGVRGESFENISKGVRAHLEHLKMYTGARIQNPVAKRTRNIQEWGILTSWQKSISGPMTFTMVAKQWAPGSKGYTRDIAVIADRFFKGACRRADPEPELVAQVRGQTAVANASKAGARKPDTAKSSMKPEKTAQRDVKKANKSGEAKEKQAALNKTPKASAKETPPKKAPAKVTAAADGPPVKLLNASSQAEMKGGTEKKVEAKKAKEPAKAKATDIQTAALTGAAKRPEKPAAKPTKSGKCKVWTASYGGAKAVIIKAVTDKMVNYTVLDVNEGSEKRETDAYINAYAKGGKRVGDFSSPPKALKKAFELCPEG
jgi:Mannosyl-glycoprotein endo-beta-N-acetylglucosaminidase